MECKELINDILEHEGYSLSRIAREASISLKTIRSLIKGTTKHPTQRTVSHVLKLYASVCYDTNGNRIDITHSNAA